MLNEMDSGVLGNDRLRLFVVTEDTSDRKVFIDRNSDVLVWKVQCILMR